MWALYARISSFYVEWKDVLDQSKLCSILIMSIEWFGKRYDENVQKMEIVFFFLILFFANEMKTHKYKKYTHEN